MIDSKWLGKVEFFKDLAEKEIKDISKLSEVVELKAGEVVFTEGDTAKGLYVLKSGKVSIEMSVSGEDRMSLYTVTKEGETFGWSALVEPFDMTASARCVEDSVLVVVSGEKLREYIQEDFHAGYLIMKRIARMMSRRVKTTRIQLLHSHYGG
ncbi:MAG: cyclic nucleotide-binding domain-containing protein [Deltaproteobacteria bacterium]|nr:cyclic nucleotide-binding domain-containing protein [Deltaproteobacteria bacterium]